MRPKVLREFQPNFARGQRVHIVGCLPAKSLLSTIARPALRMNPGYGTVIPVIWLTAVQTQPKDELYPRYSIRQSVPLSLLAAVNNLNVISQHSNDTHFH